MSQMFRDCRLFIGANANVFFLSAEMLSLLLLNMTKHVLIFPGLSHEQLLAGRLINRPFTSDLLPQWRLVETLPYKMSVTDMLMFT